MGEILLECKHLKKYFSVPNGMLHAVDDVSFSLEKGKTLGVVGESGCGKSTLGRTILRLLPHTDGEVIFEGQNILQYSGEQMKRLRTKMQIIFQDPFSSLNPRYTVFDTIEEPLKIHKVYKTQSEVYGRVKELMEVVGLAARYENAYPHELDGGRRQRIGIARALALNPSFIVCDEPVSALDVSIQAQVLNLMMDLKDSLGLTYMFITHDLSVVKHISDDIVVMYLGQIVEKANGNDIFAHPLHPYTKALLSAIPLPDIKYKGKEAETIKGELSSPINPSPGCRFAPRCPKATKKCTACNPALKNMGSDHWVSCHLYD
ncbi:ATP-binding cassette domain-containing protein [Agathobaculum sp. NTUH-O15-33]|uniref:ABC transporter ATP-binding protein n=1 Tax=Agathobaculum sp. NTUH-O15-33 TaxID=3079302 RepID=UPI002958CBB5|nr:oligopeptide/dipeptide ABC transporter ATP-binding protein [Agathobaculum sp. NTUH-O15-33]WNX83475.1 ATP-binding cassette domain-containing protein [Agathobaculum sp. NTUH-O15-33]